MTAVGSNLIQPGPGRVSTAQFALSVLLACLFDDRPPTDASHIDVHEGNITSCASSKSCVVTTLLAAPARFLSVSEVSRSRPVNVLMGDNPGDFLTAGINDTLDTLINSGEDCIS